MNQVWLYVLLGHLLFAVDVNSERSPDTILSRQKRYLIFPEGSSLQLVYDQIVPIVNNENFIIFGLTVAMAWELPSKPSYPAETDKISRKKYDKKKTTIKDDEQFVNQQKIPNNVNLYDHEHYHNYMNNDFRNYLLHKINQKLATNAYQFIKPIKYEFNNALSTHKQNTSNIFFDDSVVRYQPYSRYPALRTRRDITHKHVSNSSENLHSLKHHILSRENLYEKIVKYLTANGQNGLECVLRTICETSGISSKDEDGTKPASFANELLRTVFSLPNRKLIGHIETKETIRGSAYHQAAAYGLMPEECSTKYPKCVHSIWNDDFIIGANKL